MTLKLIGAIALIAVGVSYGQSHATAYAVSPIDHPSMVRGLLAVLFCFGGLELVTFLGPAVERPRRAQSVEDAAIQPEDVPMECSTHFYGPIGKPMHLDELHVPRADQDYAVEVGLRMLRLRRLVDETDGLYRAVPANVVLLRYYANSIAHLLTSA